MEKKQGDRGLGVKETPLIQGCMLTQVYEDDELQWDQRLS